MTRAGCVSPLGAGVEGGVGGLAKASWPTPIMPMVGALPYPTVGRRLVSKNSLNHMEACLSPSRGSPYG